MLIALFIKVLHFKRDLLTFLNQHSPRQKICANRRHKSCYLAVWNEKSSLIWLKACPQIARMNVVWKQSKQSTSSFMSKICFFN